MSTLRVNKLESTSTTDGGISIDTSGHVTIDGQQLPTAGPLSNRNLIINGAMQVAQRGTSFTASEYTLDRWYQSLSGATATTTQETFTVGSEIAQSKNYLKQSVSTGNNNCGIVYRHEGVRTISPGETCTFSFYAKGTNPAGGGLNFHVEQRFGTGGSPSSNVEVYDSDSDIVLTSDWTRYTISFTYDSYSGKTFGDDNNDYVQIEIRQKGSDTSTDAWELNITGVQLEVGETATPFEHRSYGDELVKCLRYFFKPDCEGAGKQGMMGMSYSSNTYYIPVKLPVPMRVAPSVVADGGASWRSRTFNTNAFSVTWGIHGIESTTSVTLQTSGGSITTGTPFWFETHSTSGCRLEFTAEL